MLRTLDKIHMAGELVLRAAATFRSAQTVGDFASAVVLAGAAQGIVVPFLEEAGIDSSELRMAKTIAHIQQRNIAAMTPDDWDKLLAETKRFTRAIYNGLKHAGDHRRKVALLPSNDRFIDANLENEAELLISETINDLRAVPLYLPDVLSVEALELVQSAWVSPDQNAHGRV